MPTSVYGINRCPSAENGHRNNPVRQTVMYLIKYLIKCDDNKIMKPVIKTQQKYRYYKYGKKNPI